MRHLATVREIKELRPIPDADRIETAIVDGWECVVQKGMYHPGQLVVYIEIDSVVPETDVFEFMRPRRFRVKTIRMKGQISQGLVMSLDILPQGKPYKIGDDVTEILGIKKYDPQTVQEMETVSAQNLSKKQSRIEKWLMRFKWFRAWKAKRMPNTAFPDWIKKTDEERIQNMPTQFERWRDDGIGFSITEKLDGQSATYFLRKRRFRKPEFGVCSRNRRLPVDDDSTYWTVARDFHIKAWMSDLLKTVGGSYIIVQGEIIGPKIQKNKYGLKNLDFYVFNLITEDHMLHTTFEAEIILAQYDIKTVPRIAYIPKLPSSIPALVEIARGKSTIADRQREGFVMRNANHNISFKVINPDFLLEDED